MRKNITIAGITVALLVLIVASCTFAADAITDETNSEPNTETQFNPIQIEYADPPEIVLDCSEPVFYDCSVDYMKRMIAAYVQNDIAALEHAIEARNAKICGLGLDLDVVTLKMFVKDFEAYAGFSMSEDYMGAMKRACVSGDYKSGRIAEEKRNMKLNALGLQDRIAFDDLLLLSRVITWEAGSSWLPEEWKMTVGEVLLNHVASPEFPDTLYECVYHPGSYANVKSSKFQNLTPFEDCVDIAARLLSGERIINDTSVIFQAGFKQGSGVYKEFHDSILGTTYICYSSYKNLY